MVARGPIPHKVQLNTITLLSLRSPSPLSNYFRSVALRFTLLITCAHFRLVDFRQFFPRLAIFSRSIFAHSRGPTDHDWLTPKASRMAHKTQFCLKNSPPWTCVLRYLRARSIFGNFWGLIRAEKTVQQQFCVINLGVFFRDKSLFWCTSPTLLDGVLSVAIKICHLFWLITH